MDTSFSIISTAILIFFILNKSCKGSGIRKSISSVYFVRFFIKLSL